MHKNILWKDAFQAITHSLGRYIAIILLMGLGTFAFVGLKMTGPDMRATGNDFLLSIILLMSQLLPTTALIQQIE